MVVAVWCPWVSQGPNPIVHSSPNAVRLEVDIPLWLDHALEVGLDHALEVDDAFLNLLGNPVRTGTHGRVILRKTRRTGDS